MVNVHSMGPYACWVFKLQCPSVCQYVPLLSAFNKMAITQRTNNCVIFFSSSLVIYAIIAFYLIIVLSKYQAAALVSRIQDVLYILLSSHELRWSLKWFNWVFNLHLALCAQVCDYFGSICVVCVFPGELIWAVKLVGRTTRQLTWLQR